MDGERSKKIKTDFNMAMIWAVKNCSAEQFKNECK